MHIVPFRCEDCNYRRLESASACFSTIGPKCTSVYTVTTEKLRDRLAALTWVIICMVLSLYFVYNYTFSDLFILGNTNVNDSLDRCPFEIRLALNFSQVR